MIQLSYRLGTSIDYNKEPSQFLFALSLTFWSSEGTTTGTGQAEINIFSLSVEDTGYYTCKATSAAGESEESVYVSVVLADRLFFGYFKEASDSISMVAWQCNA